MRNTARPQFSSLRCGENVSIHKLIQKDRYAEGILLLDILSNENRINFAQYRETLGLLHDAVHSEKPGLVSKSVGIFLLLFTETSVMENLIYHHY